MPPQPTVAGQIDDAHPATAEHRFDQVGPETISRAKFHGPIITSPPDVGYDLLRARVVLVVELFLVVELVLLRAQLRGGAGIRGRLLSSSAKVVERCPLAAA